MDSCSARRCNGFPRVAGPLVLSGRLGARWVPALQVCQMPWRLWQAVPDGRNNALLLLHPIWNVDLSSGKESQKDKKNKKRIVRLHGWREQRSVSRRGATQSEWRMTKTEYEPGGLQDQHFFYWHHFELNFLIFFLWFCSLLDMSLSIYLYSNFYPTNNVWTSMYSERMHHIFSEHRQRWECVVPFFLCHTADICHVFTQLMCCYHCLVLGLPSESHIVALCSHSLPTFLNFISLIGPICSLVFVSL